MLKICPQNELWRFGICGWQEEMVGVDRIFLWMK